MSGKLDQKFDLFIAYHGDAETGTVEIAKKIYCYLNDLNLRIYCHPITNNNGAFKDTHRIVQNSELFLFVVNKSVPCNEDGLLSVKDEENLERRIWQEIDSFRESNNYRRNSGIVSRLYLCADIKREEYNKYSCLDSIFNGRDCLNSLDFSDVKRWVIESLKEIKTNKKKDTLETVTGNIEKIEEKKIWDSDLAITWHKISPPSRPSNSEIEIYRKYLKFIKSNSHSAQCKALILGSTNEFRILTNEEGFDTTVVDFSKEYYQEISKELDRELKNETVVFCNWLNMSKNLNETYDVIIGDLSIGNISQDKIGNFISQISNLLKPKGFFLGKTIFHFNQKDYTRDDINKLFNDYFDRKKIEEINAYEYTMYALSLFATDENNKINFHNLFDLVCEIKERSEDKNDSIFEVYTGESTSFRDKMRVNFYVYEVGKFLNVCNDNFSIYDIEYGQDIYSKEFPLIILRKYTSKQESNEIRTKIFHEIACFLKRNQSMVDNWSTSLSSQYFLANILDLLNVRNYRPYINQIRKNIRTDIQKGVHIALDDNLNSTIDCIFDIKMVRETLNKNLQIGLEETILNLEKSYNKDFSLEEKKQINQAINTPLKNNYTLGLLCYLTWFSSQSSTSDANKLLIDELFNSLEYGSIWEPDEALWLSARICIAISTMYEELCDENKAKIEEVLKRIVYSYDQRTHLWKDFTYGSSSDTLALCINALFEYRKLLENQEILNSIDRIFKDILHSYVLDSNIYDTIVRYYVGNSIVSKSNLDIDSCKKVNDNLSVFSSLIRIIVLYLKDPNLDENIKEQLIKAEFQILDLISNVWEKLDDKASDIDAFAKNYECSLVPQIIYSCLNSIYNDNRTN